MIFHISCAAPFIFRAKFDGQRTERVANRQNPAAEPGSGFENANVPPRGRELPGCCESGNARADDD
jgi:hypothetical protein